jgi:hypothetical protein
MLTLPPLEAAGFLLHRERPPVAGLTLAPQAFYVSVCPAATNILMPFDLFQPLEAVLALEFGQFNRKLGPGDGFAVSFVGLLSTSKHPIEDKPSRARKTGKRRFLPGGRINSEPIDLSFQHSISSAL